MVELGVNVDHVATIREARQTYEPDPVWASVLAELGGADGITIHLREDRRHIQDHDLRRLRTTVQVPLNLELACDNDVLGIACEVLPDQATLVPEKREEVTTEGGLDIITNRRATEEAINALKEAGIRVSLFLDPDQAQLAAAIDMGAEAVELHTGQYALAKGDACQSELEKLKRASDQLRDAGLRIHAGHGLNYHNVGPVASIPDMRELNIGHAIVARAVLVGMQQAVAEMKAAMK